MKKIFAIFNLQKRSKIIIATLILSLALLICTQVTNFIFIKLRIILMLGLLAYILSTWALWEGITKTKAILLLILPTFFTIAVASLYIFLLPVRWLTRIPVVLCFGIAFYLILLSQNIFNVASSRTIPLYRVASTASFLFTVFTAFFVFNLIYSFNLPFYWNGVAIFLVSFFFCTPIFWSIKMDKLDVTVWLYSFIVSVLMAEGGVALSFWPLAPTIWSLSLSTFLYVLLGVLTEYLKDRLTKRLIVEYLTIGAVFLLFSYVATSWTG